MKWLDPAAEALGDMYRRGFAMFVIALPVLALVIVPEFVQHAVEINLGMFESLTRARAVQNDPLRLAIGGVKIAGLILAFLFGARFWWARDRGGRWWNLAQVRWGAFFLWLPLFVIIPLPPALIEGVVAQWLVATLSIALSVVTLPLLYLLLGAWFGDADLSARRAMRESWRFMPLMALLLTGAYLPAGPIHQYTHYLACGAPVPLVWALMTFDALVVGLLAGLTGTALYIGYAAFSRRSLAEARA